MIYIQRADANLAEWQASLRESEEGRTRDEGVFQGVYSADLKPPPPLSLTTRSAATASLRKADKLTALSINLIIGVGRSCYFRVGNFRGGGLCGDFFFF